MNKNRIMYLCHQLHKHCTHTAVCRQTWGGCRASTAGGGWDPPKRNHTGGKGAAGMQCFSFPSIASPINTAVSLPASPPFSHAVALLCPAPAPFKSYLRNKIAQNQPLRSNNPPPLPTAPTLSWHHYSALKVIEYPRVHRLTQLQHKQAER